MGCRHTTDACVPNGPLYSTASGSGVEVIRDLGGWIEHFAYNYNKGARIHSDSWGGAGYTYDQDCADVDTFLWNHLDFVSVLAAGNDGR